VKQEISNYFSHNKNQFFTLLLQRSEAKGENLTFRWRHATSDKSGTEVLGYCEYTERSALPQQKRDTCDFEFQDNYQISSRQSLIWGARRRARVLLIRASAARSAAGRHACLHRWIET
jgi:hypothetical protein